MRYHSRAIAQFIETTVVHYKGRGNKKASAKRREKTVKEEDLGKEREKGGVIWYFAVGLEKFFLSFTRAWLRKRKKYGIIKR